MVKCPISAGLCNNNQQTKGIVTENDYRVPRYHGVKGPTVSVPDDEYGALVK